MDKPISAFYVLLGRIAATPPRGRRSRAREVALIVAIRRVVTSSM
jgi:hypothetical protein